MKRIFGLAAFLCAAMVSLSCSNEEETSFSNPVIQGDLADPTVIRVGEKYYATGSSYDWSPEFPLYVSDDLVNWKQIGNILEEKPEWTSTGFWAPELFEHNGRFYCFYSAGRASDGKHCIGVAVADRPEGPYVDKGCVLDSGTEQIDSHIFNDNGTLYMTWKAHGVDPCPDEVACAKLRDDCLGLAGEEFTLIRDDERLGSEGQCMFKRDGWYYLLYSARACCGPMSDYEVRIARAKSIEGPWEKYPDNPILSGGTAEVKALGHGTVVDTPDGRLFYLCHAYFTEKNFFLGRRPFLSEFESTEDGWIRCVTGPKAQVRQKTPFRGTVQVVDSLFTADFTKETLAPSWSYPIAKGEMAVLCQRPVSADYTVSAEFNGQNAGEGGLIFFGSHSDYVTVCVTAASGNARRMIVVKTVFEGAEEIVKTWPLPESPLALSADVTDALNVTFSWTAGEENGSCVLPVGMERLMRWDSAFRPGIFSRGGEAKDAFLSFTMKSK